LRPIDPIIDFSQPEVGRPAPECSVPGHFDPQSPLSDPYRGPHKALRTALGQLLASAGRTDFGDLASIERFRVELEAVVQLLTTHARIEVQYIDPLLGAHAPDAASAIQHDHVELERELHRVGGGLHAIDEMLGVDGDGDRAAAREQGHAFYLALSRYVADYLLHIANEEEHAMPALRRSVDDATLGEALARARASIDPVEAAKTTALILASMSHPERVALLSAAGSAELRTIARLALREEDWRALADELG
jgi:hypothetical protein